MASKGVVYIVTKNDRNKLIYANYAVDSINSLRRDGKYDGSITIYSDLEKEDFALKDLTNIDIIKINPSIEGNYSSRELKTRLCHHTPYDVTLYLDADTVILKDINDIWKYADISGGWWGTREVVNNLPGTTPVCKPFTRFMNNGVILFTKDALSEKLFDAWHEEWSINKVSDQTPFVKAQEKSRVIPNELPKIYNSRVKMDDQVLYHMCGDKKIKGWIKK